MKKVLLACGTLLALGWPIFASAEVSVDSILINQTTQTEEGTNIRINLINDGPYGEKIEKVVLQARENDETDWKTLKTWTRTMHLNGHRKLALDFMPLAEGFLNPALTRPHYEVRALVTVKGNTVASASQARDVIDTAAGR